jgi:hypothetical protein
MNAGKIERVGLISGGESERVTPRPHASDVQGCEEPIVESARGMVATIPVDRLKEGRHARSCRTSEQA